MPATFRTGTSSLASRLVPGISASIKKNGVQTVTENKAATLIATSGSLLGRHSSQSTTRLMPSRNSRNSASWKWACGGHAGLNRCVVFQSTAVDTIAPTTTTKLRINLPSLFRFILSPPVKTLISRIAEGNSALAPG